MARTVYANSMVAHVWAQQKQDCGRSRNGHIFFNGRTIYSYGTHFPIATFHDTPSGRVVLFTTKDYSVTTQRHKSQVFGAIASGSTVFHVPYVTGDFNANATDYRERYVTLIGRASRARKNAQYILEQAQSLAEECRAYCAAFDVPVPELPEIAEDTLAAARETYKAEQTKRREREREREARLQEQARERVAEWRTGGYPHHLLRNLPCMLRLKGDEIETSWGATVPADHARKVWPILRRLYAANGTYQRNGHTLHLGHFTLDRVDADGTLHAGCHEIPRSEVEQIAAALGLPPVLRAA
jgi:hypothetical protein